MVKAERILAKGLIWTSLSRIETTPTAYNSAMLDDALMHLYEASRLRPENSFSYRLSATIYIARGEWARGSHMLARARLIDPGNRILAREAAVLCEKMLTISEKAQYSLIALLNNKNFYDTATKHQRECIDAWEDAVVDKRNLFEQGNKALELRDYNEALLWYRRAALFFPDSGDLWSNAGVAYEGLGQSDIAQQMWSKAVQDYNYAIERDPANRDLLYSLGQFHLQRNQPRNALQVLQRALDAQDGTVGRSSVYYDIGKAWRLTTPPDFESALAAFAEAIKYDDFGGDTWMKIDSHRQRSRIFRDRKDWVSAARELEYAVVLNPREPLDRLALASVLWNLGEKDTAKAELNYIIESNPLYSSAYFMLGRLYREAGDFDESRAMFTKVLELDPLNQDAQKELTELTSPSSVDR